LLNKLQFKTKYAYHTNETWGFQYYDDKECPLGCETIQSERNLPTFWMPPRSGKKSKPSLLFNPEDTSSKFLKKVVKFLPGYTAKHSKDRMLQTVLPAVIFNISTEVCDQFFTDSYSNKQLKRVPCQSIK